ncbi:MAG: 50S ribosomal protein L35 [Candidatus Kerfeldbacteria bacterium]|nr:50S ribosomal protein L35 [Candidatus Kerfeldbacteria bacterium]
MRQKTHKATAKRFKVTGRKKLIKRSTGQDHFNARDTGKTTRNKRSDKGLAHVDEKNIRKLIHNF